MAVQIQQDSVQPGVGLASAFESVSISGKPQEGLLGQVIGIPGVPGQHKGRSMNAVEVLLDQSVYVRSRHIPPQTLLKGILGFQAAFSAGRTACERSLQQQARRVPS